MPSKYLFLSESNRETSGATDVNPKWVNLHSLSESSRECYLKVINCKVVFNTNSTHSSLVVKARIPASNYYSSDNTDVVVAFLHQDDNKIFTIEHNNEISLLSNDGSLKNVEFVLEDNNGSVILLDVADSMEVMFKLDYVDQQELTNQYISQTPMRL